MDLYDTASGLFVVTLKEPSAASLDLQHLSSSRSSLTRNSRLPPQQSLWVVDAQILRMIRLADHTPRCHGPAHWQIRHPLYVFKDNGVCPFACARLMRSGSCCGPPTASSLGHWCTVGVLAWNERCALMPKVASRQSANPLWLLECGLVNVSWWSSKQAQRDFPALLLYVFRVPCLTTFLIHGHWNLRILTPCSTWSAVLRALRRSNCFGWL